ncbi:MAG: hypothetical protein R3281_14380 [Balneolaceae bacterium]|nr:hypothetical protein [Balneolaceae bacterium]
MLKRVVNVSRIVTGIIFLVFGINGFYTFIPVPEFHPFMEILIESGYIYLVKIVEVLAGLLLLSNRLVPLALLLLIADIVDITAYHQLLDPRNGFVVPILLLLAAILLYGYRHYFRKLLTVKAEVHTGERN